MVILSPDRLARKYAYQILILEELERFGVRAVFLEQPLDPDQCARILSEEVRELHKKLTELDREEHRLLDAYQAGLVALDQLERRQRLLPDRREHVHASLELSRGEHTAALQRAELERSVESFTRTANRSPRSASKTANVSCAW